MREAPKRRERKSQARSAPRLVLLPHFFRERRICERTTQWIARLGKLKKDFGMASEPLVSPLRLCFFIQAAFAMAVFAQTPSGQNSPLPSQATQVHGVVVPVPKEIFRSLDQFR